MGKGHRRFESGHNARSPRQALTALLAAILCCAAAPATDPYAPLAADAPEIAVLVHGAIFGEPGADGRLLAWLKAHPDVAPSERILGYEVLCNIYGAKGLNAERAAACRAGHEAGASLDPRMSQAIADVPPIRASGSARFELERNRWGGTSVPVTVNGVTLPWFVDTGAEVTVLSTSAADKLHPRLLGRTISVGTSTAGTQGELAVIDFLRIGDATVEHVPVLILPDANLGASAGAAIPAILGLPVLVAFGRVAWFDNGTILALGDKAPPVTDASHRIYWHDDGVGIPLRTAAGVMGAHFDSGANLTSLGQSFLGLLSAEELAGAEEREVHTAGAGGTIVQREKQLASVRLDVGGASVELNHIGLDAGSRSDAGRAGMDLVFPTSLFVLDFVHMTMRAEASGEVNSLPPQGN